MKIADVDGYIQNIFHRHTRRNVRSIVTNIILWYLITLVSVLLIAAKLNFTMSISLAVFGVLFFYVDIFGLDGGSVYGLAKLFGGKGRFSDHVSLVSYWKLPILFLQLVSLFLYRRYLWGLILFYLFIFAELICFYYTMRIVHKLDTIRSLLVVMVILIVLLPTLTPKEMTSFLQLVTK